MSSMPEGNGESPASDQVEISVVVPVYGCRDCLRELHRRAAAALQQATDRFELVLVDDGSPDDAWPLVRELASADPHVRGLRLSRNFGQHAAITAGLAASRGRRVVVMDCDLQDPPEEIARLYAKAAEGFDVVLTRRPRRRQPLLRRLTGSLYFRLRKGLVGGGLENNMPNLSLLSRKVVDAYLRLGEQNRQYLLIVDWLGFNHAIVDIEQDQRHTGKSSYTWGALLRVAIDGLFFQSTRMLRWIVYAGVVVAAAGGVCLVYALVLVIEGHTLASWGVLGVLILLLGGLMLAAVGVSSLYVGKIFDQVKDRPLFVVDEVAGGAQAAQEPAGTASAVSVAVPAPPPDRPAAAS